MEIPHREFASPTESAIGRVVSWEHFMPSPEIEYESGCGFGASSSGGTAGKIICSSRKLGLMIISGMSIFVLGGIIDVKDTSL